MSSIEITSLGFKILSFCILIYNRKDIEFIKHAILIEISNDIKIYFLHFSHLNMFSSLRISKSLSLWLAFLEDLKSKMSKSKILQHSLFQFHLDSYLLPILHNHLRLYLLLSFWIFIAWFLIFLELHRNHLSRNLLPLLL